ncbi:hypothetical protein IMCC3317_09290 [Kordia antarctica]|uniref:Uncharacterized protein n=1 Tax=Kordia antarctica TaxID=1218801 RepID=A0A7L4ZFX1_9FLAO|nr:hypothetical protein [Kordia antarctica]QHI35583.1 hypothetical protein IMCC3317_09290 [Kordia antarctica]
MGFFEDYERRRDERNRKGAEMLVKEFSGCLSGPIGCLGSLINGLGGFVMNIIWKTPVILFILLVSIIILLPIKLVFYVISFGRWNGFENRFIERISDVYDSKGMYL